MPEPKSRILLVTYHFPPSGGVGAQRPLSFCKYLDRMGHEVYVLTATMPVTHVYDPAQQNRIPEGVRVLRAWNPELPYSWKSIVRRAAGAPASSSGKAVQLSAETSPARRFVEWLSFPDPQKAWVPFAVRKASDAIERYGIQTVIVTVPPFSGLRIGVELKRRFPSIKLINDFRDEWIAYTLVEHRGGAGAYTVARATAAEKEAVEAADFTIAVTGSWLSLIRQRHADQPSGKFLCVPNGYDPEEMPEPAAGARPGGKIVICYAGTIDSTPVYSARRFFEALAGLPSSVKDRFEIWLAGRIGEAESRFIDGAGAKVERFGFLPRAAALEKVAQADCALLLVNTRDAHSGKVFEYMALGKPILALSVPGGEVDRLLARTRAGWCVDGSDVAAIRAALETIAAAGKNGSGPWPQPDRQAIRAFERPRLIQGMAEATGIETRSYVPAIPEGVRS